MSTTTEQNNPTGMTPDGSTMLFFLLFFFSSMTIKIPDTITKVHDLDADSNALRKYHAQFSPAAASCHQYSPFPIDQSSLRPTTLRGSHWSVAWSDLMMTMFILFLSLFVYQAAHKEYLIGKKNEILGGDTKQAQQQTAKNGSGFPFMVITPAPPLITAGTVKKIESISLQDIDLDATFSDDEIGMVLQEMREDLSDTLPTSLSKEENQDNVTGFSTTTDIIEQPMPLGFDTDTLVNDLYQKGKNALDENNLNSFASVNLVADEAVRIVLTGDLLFDSGQASLSSHAVVSLEKIAEVIQGNEYQVHIEGHTDNVPIVSDHYSSNWELSLARANAVAAFLIEEMLMSPQQFVISGYSSYRPVVPNTNITNRATNRRVEIVITKRT